MSYKVKDIYYQNSPRKILLQNENGPCPLLATANALLLRGTIDLPPKCTAEATTSDVITILANLALLRNNDSSSENIQYNLDELLSEILPKLQYGLDVNPKFTNGIEGYEYTKDLLAFDLFGINLVHGWICAASQENHVYSLVQNKSYNECIELVIKKSEAEIQVNNLQRDEEDYDVLKSNEMQDQIQQGTQIESFLNSTSHQLTFEGLSALHENLQENSLSVFFRNNHFSTITKVQGSLYLLMTDQGYAHVPNVVWERLDHIDGDSDYFDSFFQNSALDDVQAATLKSFSTTNNPGTIVQIPKDHDTMSTQRDYVVENDVDRDHALALQLQADLESEAASERLARQLQYQENNTRVQPTSHTSSQEQASSTSSCIIS